MENEESQILQSKAQESDDDDIDETEFNDVV